MEKLVTVPGRVDDLSGLYIELKRASFGVRNVGVDQNGTHVFLEPWEEKDPAPLVQSWIGKPVVSPTDKRAFKRRTKELGEAAAINVAPPVHDELVPVPVVEPDPVAETDGTAAPALPDAPAAAAAPEHPTFLKKLWKFLAG